MKTFSIAFIVLIMLGCMENEMRMSPSSYLSFDVWEKCVRMIPSYLQEKINNNLATDVEKAKFEAIGEICNNRRMCVEKYLYSTGNFSHKNWLLIKRFYDYPNDAPDTIQGMRLKAGSNDEEAQAHINILEKTIKKCTASIL